jgi:tetratricopeptide (TPR) repeat protein
MFNGNNNEIGVTVNVFLNNIKITGTLTNRYGNFFVNIQHNKTYIFEFSKPGFITERFQINTTVPDKILKEGGIGIAYQNDYEILEYFDGVKTTLFDKPVRFFTFNPKSLFFDEDLKKSQTNKINSVKTSIAQAKTKLATKELKNGDNYFKKKDYQDAFVSYNRVLELTPENSVINDKLKATKKLIKLQPEFEKNYKDLIVKADESFKIKTYSDAKENYTKAKDLKPEEHYPANQLVLIDSLISVNFAINKKEYDKIIALADQNFKDNKLEEAQKQYEKALALQIDIKYSQQKIDAIKTTLAAEKKKKEDELAAIEAKYNGLIKKADDFLSKTEFSNALDAYNQALSLKPNDTYSKGQINKTNNLIVAANNERIKKQIESNYSDTITLADKAFQIKNYKKASLFYNAAHKIKPSESYPTNQLDEITKIQNSIEENKLAGSSQKINSDSIHQINIKNVQEINTLQLKAEDLEKNGKKEEASNIYSNIGNKFHFAAQFENALKFLKKALALLKQTGNKSAESNTLADIASVYYDSGQYNQTISSYKEALSLKKEIGDVGGQAEVLSEMGEVMEYIYQYEGATANLLDALKIQQKLNNKSSISSICNKLGGIYYNQGDYQNSIKYFNNSLTIANSSNDKNLQENLLNSLGVVYYKMGKYEEAIRFYNKSIELNKQTDNKRNLSITYNNIGNVNFNWNKYEEAIDFYKRSLTIKKQLNFEQGMAASMYNIGNSYLEMKQYIKAKEFLIAGADLALKIKFNEVLQLSYKALSHLYELTNDYKSEAKSYQSYVSVLVPGMVTEGQYSEMSQIYERESKLIKTLRHDLENQKFLVNYERLQNVQKQKEIQIKDIEIKNQKAKALTQKVLLIFSILTLIITGFLALQYYLRYKQKKHYSEVIGFQKQQITDSITYASRIQKAVFIPSDQMKMVFPESFIFNLPKDVVSGDYFYMATHYDKTYVAVADCTGHGVPGAFMSMLGISLIKEVLNQDKSLSADEILNELRDALMKALHQTGRDDEAKDGMDIALCVVDINKMNLEYSGANNPCYIIRNKQLINLKSDRMPIGIHPVLKPFSSKSLNIEKGDMIYLFSDGFRDQIGYEINKKFKADSFNEMLINLSTEPIEKQPEILKQVHNNWRGTEEQTDDILIVGIRV